MCDILKKPPLYKDAKNRYFVAIYFKIVCTSDRFDKPENVVYTYHTYHTFHIYRD